MELYIGLMSGTSCDGVDVSLIKTDGDKSFFTIDNLHIPYSLSLSNAILSCNNGKYSPQLEEDLTKIHIEATNNIIRKNKYSYSEIKAIGFHGQTIFHVPKEQITKQIGNPHLLANKTGIDVIHDFRRRDIAMGGNGAPLVPIFHKLLLRNETYPVASLNIGGIANITYIDENNLIAFDIGPGNALINDAMMKYFDRRFDDMGIVASQGNIDNHIVEKILSDRYFTMKYPKTLDRKDFDFVNMFFDENKHSPKDIISTLTYVVALSVKEALYLTPALPKKLFLCGGGAKNTQLVEWIKSIIPSEIKNFSDIGHNSDYIESQAFAYLASRFMKKLPSAFPSTTGSKIENICGCLVKV